MCPPCVLRADAVLVLGVPELRELHGVESLISRFSVRRPLRVAEPMVLLPCSRGLASEPCADPDGSSPYYSKDCPEQWFPERT
jgi:hypothetical protein